MTSGLVSNARSSAVRASSASPTISRSGSRSRIWRIPTRNRAWSSTIRILIRSPRFRRSVPPRGVAPGRCSRVIRSPFPRHSGSPAGPPCPPPAVIAPRTARRSSSARSRMNWSPKLRRPRAATAPASKPRPSSRTSSTHSSVLERRGDHDIRSTARACGHSAALPAPRAAPPSGPARRAPSAGAASSVVMCSPESAACVATVSTIAPSRPSSTSTGGRSWPMKLRTSPSSRRSSSRRNRSSVAGHRRVGLEDAVDELHLEDRVRQRLGRSVVDLLGEPGALGLLRLDDPHLQRRRRRWAASAADDEGRVAALEEQPRALEVADRRARGATARVSWRPSSPRARSTSPRSTRSRSVRRRRPRPRDGAPRRSPCATRRGRTPSRGSSLHARRARRGAPASAPAPRGTRRDTGRGRRAACSRCSRAPRSPRHGVRRTGCRRSRLGAGVHPSASEYTGRVTGRRSPDAGGHGRATRGIDAEHRTPRSPASAGSSGIGRATSSKQAAAGSLPSRIAGHEPCSPPRRDEPRARRTWFGEVEDVARAARRAGRGVGPAPSRPARSGSSWMTGAAVVERGADRGHLAGEDVVRALASPREPPPNDGSSATENSSRGEDREQRAEPRDRLASSRAGARAGRCPPSSAPRALTSEQHVDRGRRRGGTCPRSSRPGTPGS